MKIDGIHNILHFQTSVPNMYGYTWFWKLLAPNIYSHTRKCVCDDCVAETGLCVEDWLFILEFKSLMLH